MNDSTLATMAFNGVNLLLPQPCVTSIEMSSSLEVANGVAGAIGRLRMGAMEWPAFALTAGFDLWSKCPEYYRFCVAFNYGDRPAFALACEEVDTISVAGNAELEPVQACMQTANNPIRSLMIRDGKLMLVSDIETIQSFLGLEAAA